MTSFFASVYQVSDKRADISIMLAIASEILISAYQITPDDSGETFEFILNYHLHATECIQLKSSSKPVSQPDFRSSLTDTLFELKHVRVNPKLDNQGIIQRLTKALEQIGVQITNQPDQQSMAVCYKPLGEMSDNVRFYLKPDGQIVFLSPATRPKLVYSRSNA